MPVTNNDPASVYLIQSWIENAGDQKDTQFVITPPLFSMQGKKEVPFSHWMRTDSQSAFHNSNASYSMSNDLKGGMTNLSGVYGTLLPDNNLNYSVQVGNTHGSNTSSGTSGYSSLNYRGAYGNTNVGYSRSGDSSQIYYGMSGGIIAHADGITFGQPLGDTMVLVKAPGADNVKIENQTGIHTDWRGYAILDEGSNTASGLGIEILDGNMRPVKLNDLHAGMQWIPLVPDQNNILPYSARLKSTQKSVNPGLVSASATFTLEFQ